MHLHAVANWNMAFHVTEQALKGAKVIPPGFNAIKARRRWNISSTVAGERQDFTRSRVARRDHPNEQAIHLHILQHIKTT
jgi:hypothetical protein